MISIADMPLPPIEMDLVKASFALEGRVYDNLEHGVVVGITGLDLMVESLSRPGHTLLLPMTNLLRVKEEGQKVLAHRYWSKSEREYFDPDWSEVHRVMR